MLGIVAPLWAQREGKLSRPLDGLAARFARTHGPFDSEEAACTLGVGVALAAESLERLAAEGRLVRLGPDRWADGAVLARLRSRSLARAREAVRPVPADAYVRFLLDRQDIARAGEPTLAGVDGVAQVIAQFEGAALPMEQWEREVLPARVPDYRPAMLDELIAAGEVLWAASTVGEAHPISFFPTDSPLAPLPVDAQAGVAEVSAAEPGELEDPSLDAIVRHVLVAQGPLTFRALTDGAAQLAGSVARTDREVAEALQRLVWKGEATSDGLGFPRAGGLAAAASASAAGGQTPPPSRRRASSRRGRSLHSEARRAARAAVVGRQVASTAFDAALAGRWSALAPSGQSSTVQAVALVESLLDRYGVVTRDIALAAGVPGGLSMLYPVLKAMEEAGDLARGMFVEGMGPAQFAQRETVEALRAFAQPADASAPASLVALPADDPACLFGAGIPWPDVAWDAVGEAPAVDSALVAARPVSPRGSACGHCRWLAGAVGRAAPEIAAGVFRRRKIAGGGRCRPGRLGARRSQARGRLCCAPQDRRRALQRPRRAGHSGRFVASERRPRAPSRRLPPLCEPVLKRPRRKKKGRCASLRRGGPAIPAAVPLMIRSRSELARGKESGRRPERRTAAPRVPGALCRVPA